MLRYNLALALETGWQSSVEKMVYVALVSSPFIDGTLFLKGNASLESAFVMLLCICCGVMLAFLL